MPRGGPRAGAGRSPKLDFSEKIEVGSECEKRFREIWEKARTDAWENRPGVDRLHFLQGKFRHSLPDSKESRNLSAQIEKVVREMKRTPSFVAETKRGFSIYASRPKDVTERICREVASEFAQRWDRPDIGQRYARRCWDEYRRFVKESEPF